MDKPFNYQVPLPKMHPQPLRGRVPRPPRTGREVATQDVRDARMEEAPWPQADPGPPPQVGSRRRETAGTAGREGQGIDLRLSVYAVPSRLHGRAAGSEARGPGAIPSPGTSGTPSRRSVWIRWGRAATPGELLAFTHPDSPASPCQARPHSLPRFAAAPRPSGGAGLSRERGPGLGPDGKP